MDRQTEFEWVKQYLSRWVRIMEKGPFGISLSAKRRIGKTAFLEKLVNEVLLKEPDILPFPIFLKEEYEQDALTSLNWVSAWIIHSILSYHRGKAVPFTGPSKLLNLARTSEDVPEQIKGIVESLEALKSGGVDTCAGVLYEILRYAMEYAESKGKRAFIIIDEFQTLTRVRWRGETISITHGLKGIVESAHSPVVLVSGSAVGMMLSTATNGILAGRFTPLPFEGLPLEAVSELCQRWAKKHGINFSNDAVHTLFAKTLGIPGYIIEILRSLPDKTDISPTDIEQAFQTQTSPGGNLYRFWSDHLRLYSRTFPSASVADSIIASLAAKPSLSWKEFNQLVPNIHVQDILLDAGIVYETREGLLALDPVLSEVLAAKRPYPQSPQKRGAESPQGSQTRSAYWQSSLWQMWLPASTEGKCQATSLAKTATSPSQPSTGSRQGSAQDPKSTS